jgi:hypothetical protein
VSACHFSSRWPACLTFGLQYALSLPVCRKLVCLGVSHCHLSLLSASLYVAYLFICLPCSTFICPSHVSVYTARLLYSMSACRCLYCCQCAAFLSNRCLLSACLSAAFFLSAPCTSVCLSDGCFTVCLFAGFCLSVCVSVCLLFSTARLSSACLNTVPPCLCECPPTVS